MSAAVGDVYAGEIGASEGCINASLLLAYILMRELHLVATRLPIDLRFCPIWQILSWAG